MSVSAGKLPKLAVGFHTGDARAGFDGIEPKRHGGYKECLFFCSSGDGDSQKPVPSVIKARLFRSNYVSALSETLR